MDDEDPVESYSGQKEDDDLEEQDDAQFKDADIRRPRPVGPAFVLAFTLAIRGGWWNKNELRDAKGNVIPDYEFASLFDSKDKKNSPLYTVLETLLIGEERCEDYTREFFIDKDGDGTTDNGTNVSSSGSDSDGDAKEPIEKRGKVDSRSDQAEDQEEEEISDNERTPNENKGTNNNGSEYFSTSSGSSCSSSSMRTSPLVRFEDETDDVKSNNSNSTTSNTFKTRKKGKKRQRQRNHIKVILHNNLFHGPPQRSKANSRFYHLALTKEREILFKEFFKLQQTTTNSYIMSTKRVGNSPGHLYTILTLKEELIAVKLEFGHVQRYKFALESLDTTNLSKDKFELCQTLSRIRKDGVPCSTQLKEREIFVTTVKKWGTKGKFKRKGKIFSPFNHPWLRNTRDVSESTTRYDLRNILSAPTLNVSAVPQTLDSHLTAMQSTLSHINAGSGSDSSDDSNIAV